MVVWSHILLAFYPLGSLGSQATSAPQHMRFEDGLYGSPLAVAYAGTFAVAIFFVLSGFVLSIGYFQTKRAEIIKKLAAKRYLRLMLPALASIFLCLLLIKLGASNVQEAAAITQSNWMKDAWNFDAGFFHALTSGMIGIFTGQSSPYNSVLWTMMTEFLGSFMVFGFILLFAQSKYRWVGYAVLCVAVFNTWFLPFMLGMVLADAYSTGYLRQHKKLYITALLAGSALFLGGYPQHGVDGTVYHFLEIPMLSESVNFAMLYLTIAAVILVYAVVSSEKLAKFMRLRRVSILGKYTFSLYLVHLSILYTFMTGIFVALHSFMGYNRSFLVAFLLSLPVIFVATKLFEKYVDSPSVKFAGQWAEVFEGKKELKPRRYLAATWSLIALRYAMVREKITQRIGPTEDVSPE